MPDPPRSGSADAEPPAADERPLAALGEALDAVGDRWTLLLVATLLDGPRRFGDLQAAVGGIAPNVLTSRLRRLEAEGLVLAEPYSERPPRHVYELTAAGRGLAGALRLLADWGARHGNDAEPPRHAACGTPLEAVWWCPTCERPAEEDEPGDVAHL
jgi:DNA-binding HxlR family transcriptional regulator